jgi:hypothetical protein
LTQNEAAHRNIQLIAKQDGAEQRQISLASSVEAQSKVFNGTDGR